MVDLWYSKYMVYSLRAFFTAAHFFIGGIVPEILIIHENTTWLLSVYNPAMPIINP